MPDMDGFEATAAIRALDRASNVPIVAVTASAFTEDRERCRRAGMNGYVTKPLRREDLLEAISTALASRGLASLSTSILNAEDARIGAVVDLARGDRR